MLNFTETVRYRLQVTNLNASVSESDLVDLFCAIGAVRDSRLQSTGEAIVTFVKRAAAMAAITKYNGRELDGQKISGMFSKFCGLKCIVVNPYRIMELPRKLPYQWRNEYPTKKPRVRQELVGEIHPSILLPAITGVTAEGKVFKSLRIIYLPKKFLNQISKISHIWPNLAKNCQKCLVISLI